ncbi:GPO family capsid scaffolding protein [Alcaligenaceae bacterium SJ-26]|nr:GPO family capsid scaffolding protein [Alcaligenaceae bacterium SJ-26]
MKFKSKWTCVATEGGTTDGREISREWIEQMAATFDPKKYGARVWLEHLRGVLPDGPFRAYGDVLAAEARQKSDGKLGLYVQIDPTSDLVKMNKDRQKIYTSIEVNPNFAGSGQAYLVGLAVTDSPASLGTDMLAFTQKNPAGSPLTERKQDKDNLFSAAEETVLEFEQVEDSPSLSDRIAALVQPFRRQSSQNGEHIGQLLEAFELQGQAYTALAERAGKIEQRFTELQSVAQDLEKLQGAFEKFKGEVEATDASGVQRPAAAGGTGAIETDC